MSTKTVKATTKKTVGTKSTKNVDIPVKVEVVETPVVKTEVVETPGVVDSSKSQVSDEHVEAELNIRQRLEVLIKSRQDLMNELKKEITELKKLQKDHETELKNASKKHKKKKSSDDTVTRKPSGFASPVVVSDALYNFLAQFGVEKGQPIARTDVTRHITNYISEHNLQNPEYRREIKPDGVLKALFGEPTEHKVKGDTTSPLVYTYLQLQRYISPHFPKSAKVAAK